MPYNHAARLHDALTKAGVPNQLLTIPKAVTATSRPKSGRGYSRRFASS